MSMELSAFHADESVRADAIARLSERLREGCLVPGPLAWNGRSGSVVGCLIDGGDFAIWPQRLGLPVWLAHALDAVTGPLPPEMALNQAVDVLHAVPLGIDASRLGSGLVCLLVAGILGDQPSSLPQELQLSGREVSDLHRKSQHGELVEPTRWKTIRRQAMLQTDGIDARLYPRERSFGLLLEVAAWDPYTSPATIADVLRQWMALDGESAAEGFGWTTDDDLRVRELLDRMHREYVLTNNHQDRDVFLLLEEHHPAVASRLRAWIQCSRESAVSSAQRAAGLLTQSLRAGLNAPL